MTEYKMIALSSPLPDREEEFAAWYTRHVGDICAVPGIVGGQLCKIVHGTRSHAYATIYDVATDDPAGLLAEIFSRLGTDAMPATDALDRETVYLSVLQPIGSYVQRK